LFILLIRILAEVQAHHLNVRVTEICHCGRIEECQVSV
jgi:hypothetical protein